MRGRTGGANLKAFHVNGSILGCVELCGIAGDRVGGNVPLSGVLPDLDLGACEDQLVLTTDSHRHHFMQHKFHKIVFAYHTVRIIVLVNNSIAVVVIIVERNNSARGLLIGISYSNNLQVHLNNCAIFLPEDRASGSFMVCLYDGVIFRSAHRLSRDFKTNKAPALRQD